MAAAEESRQRVPRTAWLGLALVAALGLTQWMIGSGQLGWSLIGASLGAWVLVSWIVHRAVLSAIVTAAIVLLAAILGWHLPWSIAWFVPLWAVLFWVPSILRDSDNARAERFPRLAEGLRATAAAGAGLLSMAPFLHNGLMGGSDARWYASVIADHLEQWRMGLGPVFVGQTRFGAIGTVMPLRVAPYLQHLTLALDFVTGRSLSPFLLLNLALVLSGVAAGLSAYLCLRAILPSRRIEALLLAVLYVWCPAVAGLAYTGQLFMSMMTLPYLPVVFAGVARIFMRDGFSGWAMVAAGCAACWLAHTPIGLWVSISAAVAILCRWAFGLGWTRRDLGRALGATLLFGGLCGYVFVSVSVLAPPSTPSTPKAGLPLILRAMFPAMLEPLSRDAGLLTDLQPGWSLLAVLLAGTVAGWRRRSMAAIALSFVALLLLCLSFPIPGINGWVWQRIPQVVVNVTNGAPSQRLYPILAACVAVLAASALAAAPKRREWVLLALAAGVLWSGFEFRRFLHRGPLLANSKAHSEELLAANNLVPSSFSTGFLGEANNFFSYGFMDFELEQRVLSQDQKSYLVSNVGAVAPGFDFGVHASHRQLPGLFSGSAAPDGRRWIDLHPAITLKSGQRYLLVIDFPDDDFTGVLQVQGPGLYHEYQLPLSGQHFAFGATSDSSRALPLFNDSEGPRELKLDFVVQDSRVDLARYRNFARYQLLPYERAQLPIRLQSLVPYVAQVRTPAAGWYESFRYYTRGWTATVNGRPAPVSRSRNGLIAVPVAAGESEVRLIYRAPLVLLAAYWLTAVTWISLAIAGAAVLARPMIFIGSSKEMP